MTPDALDELAPALAAFQAEVPVIPNTERADIRTNSGERYGYKYAGLGSIMPIVAPLLAKHGLAFTAMPMRVDGGGVLVGMLLHTSGQRLTGELPITGRTPQEIGSSLTYGRRYLLSCLVGIVTDDDDDGSLAERAAAVVGRGVSAVAASARESATPAPARPSRPAPEAPVSPPGSQGRDDPLNTSSGLAKAMYAALREAGIDREHSHDLFSEVTGRDITSSKDLTNGEARRVLDFLPQRAPIAPEEEPPHG